LLRFCRSPTHPDNCLYRDFPPFPVIAIAPGEETKSLGVIEFLATRLLDLGIDRSGFILAIGGGVICDIAGFLGSIYMRGIRFGFVSTTLLSQVDASIGGKNAVNIGQIKNTLGTFRQPEFVICDPSMLKTLHEEEYLSGLAELIKNGIVMDEALVNNIGDNRIGIIGRDAGVLSSLIGRSVELKASVVSEDEKESGRRMILNFGHTFGHPIEVLAKQKHGFAIAAGMVIAADISVKEGILGKNVRDRITDLLTGYNLIREHEITHCEFERLIMSDKKKSGAIINFVLLESMGHAIIRKYTPVQLLKLYGSIKY
jgi:3-dehydroquinate synthase